MSILEKSPIYREILQKGIDIGVEEGREQGHKRAIREAEENLLWTLKQTLDRRLGPAPLNLPEQLGQLSFKQLQMLIIEAATATGWDDFLARFDEIN